MTYFLNVFLKIQSYKKVFSISFMTSLHHSILGLRQTKTSPKLLEKGEVLRDIDYVIMITIILLLLS